MLVIVGHIVLGSVHTDTTRYIVYAFHMPMFIGLTGYLINAETLTSASALDVSRRYWWRMLFPFAFAFAFFTGALWLHAWQESRLDFRLVLTNFVTPYYHLWFIPTLVLWVAGLWVALKCRFSVFWLSNTFILISLIWACIPSSEFSSLAAALLSKKVIYFYGFFLFGAYLKSAPNSILFKLTNRFRLPTIAVTCLAAAVYISAIGPQKEAFKGLAWLVMNLSLLVLCISWLKENRAQSRTNNLAYWFLAEMGRVSLPIYLWHMVPMFLLKGWDVHQTSPTIYYATSLAGTALIVALLINLENKSALLNKALYGQ